MFVSRMFDDLSYTEVAGDSADSGATIFALSSCEHCREAMAAFATRGLGYRYIYVDEQAPENRIRIKKELGNAYQRHLVFPILELPGGEEHIFGWDEGVWMGRLGV